MKKALVFGSLNYDYVYTADHIVAPGETLASESLSLFFGGKGFNQSVALARAGAQVYHAGLVGEDGDDFIAECSRCGIRTDFVKKVPGRSGHTIIQVDKNGENCILLYGGSNRKMTEEYIDSVLSHFEKGDCILLQNEINLLSSIIEKAADKGLTVVLNPSPFEEYLHTLPLSLVSYFLVNEIEGEQMTGEKEPQKILDKMLSLYPSAAVVLTLGSEGAYYADRNLRFFREAFPVKAVDTTAAGDTFTGFLIAALQEGQTPQDAMHLAAKASSIAVTRMGASPSIPFRSEIEL